MNVAGKQIVSEHLTVWQENLIKSVVLNILLKMPFGWLYGSFTTMFALQVSGIQT